MKLSTILSKIVKKNNGEKLNKNEKNIINNTINWIESSAKFQYNQPTAEDDKFDKCDEWEL